MSKGMINDNPRHLLTKEEMSRGGRSRSPLKRMNAIKNKRCRNCRLPCPLKERGIEENWRCKVPEVRKKVLETLVDRDNLKESIILDLFEMQMLSKGFDSRNKTARTKIKFLEVLEPNKNINVNLDMGEVLARVYEERHLKKDDKKD